ncbi:MAG: RNase adapter RapZ [Eubacterium sp.]|nr:RNase adapter RapZ [Eubacterium sp.]
MRLVIVSGLSGAGKSSVMKILEDDGFYCVDNLPVPLVPDFMSLLDIRETIEEEKAGNLHPDYAEDVAIGLDVRGLRFNSGTSDDTALDKMLSVIGFFRKQGYSIDIIFLEASTQVLVKRYKETRRIHPLFRMSMPGSKSDAGSAPGDGVDVAESGVRVGDAIELEGRLLRPIREAADVILDTSSLLVRDLKQEIDRLFLGENTSSNFYLTFVSFGYKYGIPTDADLVFDVRFLPNPYYVEELKPLTGNDKGVEDYVMNCETAETFLKKLTGMIDFLIPNYRIEGKTGLVIAVGCTGGKHRSVTLTNKLYEHYKNGEFGCKKDHRDIDRDRVRKQGDLQR